MKQLTLAFLLAAALGAAHAQTYEVVQPIETRPLRFLAGGGLTFGGDKLATAVYEDGTEIDIDAGGTIALHVGVDYRFAPQFSVQGTVGYHVDSASARNGDLRFERVPVELLGYYHVNEQLRVGGGIRFVTNAALRSGGPGGFGDSKFDDTTSALAEMEYMVSPRWGVKLRYVNEQFKEKGYAYRPAADHVGLLANYYF